jgi:hypothetical protein
MPYIIGSGDVPCKQHAYGQQYTETALPQSFTSLLTSNNVSAHFKLDRIPKNINCVPRIHTTFQLYPTLSMKFLLRPLFMPPHFHPFWIAPQEDNENTGVFPPSLSMGTHLRPWAAVWSCMLTFKFTWLMKS